MRRVYSGDFRHSRNNVWHSHSIINVYMIHLLIWRLLETYWKCGRDEVAILDTGLLRDEVVSYHEWVGSYRTPLPISGEETTSAARAVGWSVKIQWDYREVGCACKVSRTHLHAHKTCVHTTQSRISCAQVCMWDFAYTTYFTIVQLNLYT